jgi:hypothetical protein
MVWQGSKSNSYTNHLIRRKKYKMFWKMIDDRGLWRDDRYQRKKQELFQRCDDPVNKFVIWTSRQVMPDCVLTFIRNLYPNPDGVQYMGHKWR